VPAVPQGRGRGGLGEAGFVVPTFYGDHPVYTNTVQSYLVITMSNLIAVQDEYVETVNAGIQRWAHRKGGGHAGRIASGARRRATKQLLGLGYTVAQIPVLIRDAADHAALLRLAEVE